MPATAVTTSSEPVTIEPASGLSDPPVLDGDGTFAPSGETCSTASCAGPILTVPAGEYVALSGLTIADADNTTTSTGGGGLENHGTVTVSGSSFTNNSAAASGGAIDNANDQGSAGATGSVTVTGSTFSGNSAGQDGGAIDSGDSGGDGSLTVTGSTFTSNSASLNGGAIDSGDHGGGGSVTVTGSTFTANSTGNNGGAIDGGDTGGGGPVTVTGATFAGNYAASYGGAIDSFAGSVTVSRSTITSNRAELGGAIFANGSATVSESTLTGNSAVEGGGAIFNANLLTVTTSSLTGDSAGDGGAEIYNGGDEVWVTGDIFGGSCYQYGGGWQDEGYNAGSDSSCFGSPAASSDVDAGSVAALDLGPLASNGGPTQTVKPQPGSPAIGIIPDPTTVTAGSSQVQLCPVTDQRGKPSPAGPCAAGSVQTGAPWQPPAVAGSANVKLGAAEGYYLGTSDDTWRLLASDPAKGSVTYSGTITVSGGYITKIMRLGLPGAAKVGPSGSKTVKFSFTDAKQAVNGFRFTTTPAVMSITFTLSVNGQPATASQIYLGSGASPSSAASPVTFTR